MRKFSSPPQLPRQGCLSRHGRGGRLLYTRRSVGVYGPKGERGNLIEHNARQDKTRRDKKGQDKTGYDKEKQDKTTQDRTTQDRAGQEGPGRERDVRGFTSVNYRREWQIRKFRISETLRTSPTSQAGVLVQTCSRAHPPKRAEKYWRLRPEWRKR